MVSAFGFHARPQAAALIFFVIFVDKFLLLFLRGRCALCGNHKKCVKGETGEENLTRSVAPDYGVFARRL